MWAYEHSVETDVTPEAVWALWRDVAGWGTWNGDIEAVSLTGPFAVGSEISMTPIGQEPVVLRLEVVVENREFTDVCEAPGLEIRTRHLVEPVAGGVRVTYRTEISGPAADQVGPELGPQITGDFPETIAALVKRAALVKGTVS